jgi:hypothetical protein
VRAVRRLRCSFPLALLPPSARKPPQLEAGSPGSAVATARAQPRLGRRPRQSDLLSPVPQHVVEAFCLCWSVDRADDLIRVADEARLPSTGLLDPCFHPEGQHGGQNHRGQEGCYRAPWRGAGRRVEPLALGVEPPSLEPLRINRRRAPSSIRAATIRTLQSWSMVSKTCVMSASTPPADRPHGRVLVRVSTASRAPPCGRSPSLPRRKSCSERASRRRATARCRRFSATAGMPSGRWGPSPVGRSCRLTRLARSRCCCSRSTRGWRFASQCCSEACALPWATPASASPRPASHRDGSPEPPCDLPPASLCPAGRVALGVRSCMFGQRFLGRRRLPGRPCPRCPARPAPRTRSRSAALPVFGSPGGWPTGGRPLRTRQGLPSACRVSPRSPRAWWTPTAPREAHQHASLVEASGALPPSPSA